MSKCDVPAVLEEVSKILRVISDVVKNPADSRRPIPSGWVVLGPAKLQPRKPGDKHWSIAAGEWVDTPDDAIEYANLDDWRAIRKVDEDAGESSVAKLLEGLAKAMQYDSDLAWTWHCYIAVGSLDEGVCHETANLAAARFMSTAFGVDVTTFDQWKSFLSWEDNKEIPSKTPDHIADANKMVNCPVIPDSSDRKPIAIPAGWRELEPDEVPVSTDMHEWMGGWFYRKDDATNEYKWYSSRHIRKIESDETKPIEIPDGYRELTADDFVVFSDLWEDGDRWIQYTYDPSSHVNVKYDKGFHVRHIRKIEPAEPKPIEIPDGPIAIPEGWRELNIGELLSKTDMYESNGKWNPYVDSNPAGSNFPRYSKGLHYRHIRKIEPANPSETPNSSTATEWIPNVGDKVRVNKPSRVAHGKVGVIVEANAREYAVWIEGENFTSFNLESQYLELIEASNCRVIPDSSAGELLVDTAVKFNDGSGTVPGLSGWTVEPDAYIGCLSVFPVPHGWMMICPEAKSAPRVVGDMFYRITKGQWEELTEANVEQANKQNWTAIRKIPSVVVDQSELLGSKPQYRDPTAADIGKTIEVRSEYCTLWEERELVSICNEEIDNRFVCRHKNDPKRLKLWSNARIKVQEHIL